MEESQTTDMSREAKPARCCEAKQVMMTVGATAQLQKVATMQNACLRSPYPQQNPAPQLCMESPMVYKVQGEEDGSVGGVFVSRMRTRVQISWNLWAS